MDAPSPIRIIAILFVFLIFSSLTVGREMSAILVQPITGILMPLIAMVPLRRFLRAENHSENNKLVLKILSM